MAKNKAIFSTLNECNTKQIFGVDDKSLSVLGYITIQLNGGHFDDILCVTSLSYNHFSLYQISHLGEGKNIEFSPHQVVIKNLEDPKYILAARIVVDIAILYKY